MSAKEFLEDERQVADLTAYAAAAGLEVVHVYEEKASGAKKDREVLADCLDFLKSGGAQHLLVTELSRLGRNLRQVLGIVEDLTDIGDYYPVNWSEDDAIAVSEQADLTKKVLFRP